MAKLILRQEYKEYEDDSCYRSRQYNAKKKFRFTAATVTRGHSEYFATATAVVPLLLNICTKILTLSDYVSTIWME